VVRTLYVGNLPWATKAEDLERVFAQYGEVISSRVITDRETGRSRGFGFVAALNGTEMEGRVLTVNEAKAREERPS